MSICMTNRNGLSAEPWWRPIPTSNCSLVHRLNFTHMAVHWYISCTRYTSGIFRFRMRLHSTSRGTVSHAFSRSMNNMSRGLLPYLYFSHMVLMTNIASVVPTPDLKPNCPSEMPTMFLTLWSMIRSHSFIVWLSSLACDAYVACLSCSSYLCNDDHSLTYAIAV